MHQIGERLQRLLDRRVRVLLVHLVDVDVIRAQALERTGNRLLDVVARAAARERALARRHPEFGRDQHVLAPRAQRLGPGTPPTCRRRRCRPVSKKLIPASNARVDHRLRALVIKPHPEVVRPQTRPATPAVRSSPVGDATLPSPLVYSRSSIVQHVTDSRCLTKHSRKTFLRTCSAVHRVMLRPGIDSRHHRYRTMQSLDTVRPGEGEECTHDQQDSLSTHHRARADPRALGPVPPRCRDPRLHGHLSASLYGQGSPSTALEGMADAISQLPGADRYRDERFD